MTSYLTHNEKKLTKTYLENGYLIVDINDLNSFKIIDKYLKNQILRSFPKITYDYEGSDIFDHLHKYVKVKTLNDLRIKLIKSLFATKEIKKAYYDISKEIINLIVGNEIAMQKRLNLSIQLPNDKCSLLSVHADTWSGDSPYEVVVWLPLVDCYKSKSMFILSPKKTRDLYKNNLSTVSKGSNKILYKKIKKDLKFINIKRGQFLIFNQNLPHGNIVNETNLTRVSMNCRFKSLFSPYFKKELGEFFEPVSLRAASIDGMKFNLPKI